MIYRRIIWREDDGMMDDSECHWDLSSTSRVVAGYDSCIDGMRACWNLFGV